MPGIIAAGTKTAVSVSAMPISAPPTSSIVLCAASWGSAPPSISRCTFSTTTIASSTTMPIASTSPNSDRLLSEKPAARITANVPTSETGIASSGMIVARHVCRNTITTIETMMSASNKVCCTALIASWMKSVVS